MTIDIGQYLGQNGAWPKNDQVLPHGDTANMDWQLEDVQQNSSCELEAVFAHWKRGAKFTSLTKAPVSQTLAKYLKAKGVSRMPLCDGRSEFIFGITKNSHYL